MKRVMKLLIAVSMLVALFAITACADRTEDNIAPIATAPPTAVATPTPAPPTDGGNVTVVTPGFAGLYDLDENRRFAETVRITATVWDRSVDRLPDFTQSYWVQWLQAAILEEHNIHVDFIGIPRWGEYDHLTTLLAAGNAPDVGFTFQFPVVQTFADMGAIMDLRPLLDAYRHLLPNMYELLTPTNIYWNQDAVTGELWAMEGRHLDVDHRLNTFVRTDWLDTLGLSAPTTMQQFEDMLVAFRDNAELLLGADAHMMIPYRLTSDVGWTGDPVITSFIPNDITDRQWYVYGFDDRRFLMPGIKEGVRQLNRWYNMGLIWEDFPLHGQDDPRGDDLIRLGFVGSFSGNWDLPFRSGDRLIVEMQENVGPHANFTVVHPFQNDAGIVRMQVPPPSADRKLFIPISACPDTFGRDDRVPLAVLMYFDFISRPEIRQFLQFGIEGVHHIRHASGAIEALGERPAYITDEDGNEIPNPLGEHRFPDNQLIPSLRNFDLLATVNGIDLGDPAITSATLGLAYPGISPEQIALARSTGERYAWRGRVTQIRGIEAEAGMGPPLNGIRFDLLNRAVVASEADFDSVFDSGMTQYLNAGGAAIIAERNQAWIEAFGDIDNLP